MKNGSISAVNYNVAVQWQPAELIQVPGQYLCLSGGIYSVIANQRYAEMQPSHILLTGKHQLWNQLLTIKAQGTELNLSSDCN